MFLPLIRAMKEQRNEKLRSVDGWTWKSILVALLRQRKNFSEWKLLRQKFSTAHKSFQFFSIVLQLLRFLDELSEILFLQWTKSIKRRRNLLIFKLKQQQQGVDRVKTFWEHHVERVFNYSRLITTEKKIIKRPQRFMIRLCLILVGANCANFENLTEKWKALIKVHLRLGKIRSETWIC